MNPFWSEQVQKNVLGPGVGDSQRTWQQGAMSPDVGSTSGGPQHYVIHGGLSQRDVEEIDEMRRRATMELEERLRQEADKRRQESISGSYRSAATGIAAGVSATPVGPLDGVRGGAGPPLLPGGMPPGLTGGPGSAVTGESLSDSLRNLELPKLPSDASALAFGDWLTIIEPLMSDMTGNAIVLLQEVSKTLPAEMRLSQSHSANTSLKLMPVSVVWSLSLAIGGGL